MYTPAEVIDIYADIGAAKAAKPARTLFIAGIFAGFIIGMGAAVANTASYALAAEHAWAARVISGLLFPFGLGIVIIAGMELFTGNTLICISVLDKKTRVLAMLRNWLVVIAGNFCGALLVAAGNVYAGQIGLAGGALAVYTIKTAAVKCGMPVGSAFVLGIFCNIMVCLGVLLSLSA
ncbi:MAG: formate/nitrite transporter family protein, partial [Defluviitaleaceae bacterium]|nr:formate/nitrite transporter family protein [Defluviitaleaceae bacterium]